MAIVATDLITRLSGGSGNSNPNASLGGALSSTAWAGGVLHDLFDAVSALENAASNDDYRAIYVLNNHASLTAYGVTVYLSDQVAGGATLAIAVADEAKNTAIETVADADTPPVGPSFSSPTTQETGISLGDLGPGEYRGLWLRRTAANTAAVSNDGGELTIWCETEA